MKNLRSIYLLPLLAALQFCLPALLAAEETSVSLQSLLVLGLERNLGLQAARLALPNARNAIIIEEGGFDTELFANTDYLETQTPYASSLSPATSIDASRLSGTAGLRKRFASGLSASLSLNSSRIDESPTTEVLNPRYKTGFSLDLSQPLLRNFGNTNNLLSLNLARGRSQQAEYRFLQQAQNLVLTIETGYYDLLLARSSESLRLEAWQLSRKLYAGNQRKFDAGIIPISEVQEAETAVAGNELEYVLAQQQREVQTHRLNGLLNDRLPESLATPQSAAVEYAELIQPQKAYFPNAREALTSAEQSRPDLLIAAIDVTNSELGENAARNRSRPRLDLDLHLSSEGLSGSEDPAGSSPYRGDWSDSFSSSASADGYQWGAGLRFSYPLGNRSLKAAVRVSADQRRQAQLTRRDLLSRVETELRERLTQVQRLGQLVEIANRFQQLAEVSFKQETRRLEEGFSDSFRVLSFQEKMIAARIARVAALVEYNKSLASLSYAMGTNLLRHGIVANLSAREIRFEEN
jgi:outer membrane protein TolC